MKKKRGDCIGISIWHPTEHKIQLPEKLLAHKACNMYHLQQTAYGIVWLVIFARELFLRFSWIGSHSQKLRYPHAWQPNHVWSQRYFKLPSHCNSNRSLWVSVPFDGYQKCCINTDKQTSWWCRAKSGNNHLYKHPRYKANLYLVYSCASYLFFLHSWDCYLSL